MNTQRRVLITGRSGLIGQCLWNRSADSCILTGLSRRPSLNAGWFCGDVSDLGSILPAFQGQDTVVHLAAVARTDATWEEVLPHNVVGTYNVFEAARISGVRRVVFASSGAVVSGWERESPYDGLAEIGSGNAPKWERLDQNVPVRPNNLYGCSKVWGEALGRYYSDVHELSVICVRLGAVLPDDRPETARQLSVWCSKRDAVDVLARCVELPPQVRFDTFYALSNNTWGYRDLNHVRNITGFVPQDSADTYADSFSAVQTQLNNRETDQ